jgi:hypothetical protein
MSHVSIAALLSSALLSTSALAQSYEDLDGSNGAQKAQSKEVVREIVRGTYAKANVGAGFYLGQFAQTVSPGTAVGMSFGGDFIDQKKMSMAWEVSLFQGINNGAGYEEQDAAGCAQLGNCIQGDLRTYSILGFGEASWYPTRRLGVGLRAGVGILMSPLLISEKYYHETVVDETWGLAANPPTYHDTAHPVVVGGPTFEYYTKLSHFSVGIDTDIFMAMGFDLGATATGYMKYTF